MFSSSAIIFVNRIKLIKGIKVINKFNENIIIKKKKALLKK